MSRIAWSALCLAWAAAVFGTAPARAQEKPDTTTTLVVRILDDATGKPIEGAQLTVGGTRLGGSTDRKGVAQVKRVPAGARMLRVSSLGFASDSVQVTFAAGTPVDTELRLVPAPVALPGILAAGQAGERVLRERGFYERARVGGATFIAGERLQKLQTRTNRLAAAFDNVPGVRVTPNMRGSGYILVSTRSSAGDNFSGERCYPIVYLDDVKVKYDFSMMQGRGSSDRPMENADPNSLVPLSDVLGVEIYQGIANVPYQYDRNPCGVVLIWTRRGK